MPNAIAIRDQQMTGKKLKFYAFLHFSLLPNLGKLQRSKADQIIFTSCPTRKLQIFNNYFR
jgi:hypothetical protein